MSYESEYWWYARCFVAGMPYIVVENSVPVVVYDGRIAEGYENTVAALEGRLREGCKSDKRLICMLRAQAKGLLDYKSICADPQHPWRDVDAPALREELAFEEVARDAHVTNNVGQLLGLLAMMIQAEDRDLVADMQEDIRQMTCPWDDRSRLTKVDRAAQAFAFLKQQAEREGK